MARIVQMHNHNNKNNNKHTDNNNKTQFFLSLPIPFTQPSYVLHYALAEWKNARAKFARQSRETLAQIRASCKLNDQLDKLNVN